MHLLAIAGGAAAQDRVFRVGCLSWQDAGPYYEVTNKRFIDDLREQGFVECRNLTIGRRSSDFGPARSQRLARENHGAKRDKFSSVAKVVDYEDYH